jgi:hypothetical protein
LARRHIETAISHINDRRAESHPVDDRCRSPAPEVDELRLIVRALADIREALRTTDGPNPLDSTI